MALFVLLEENEAMHGISVAKKFDVRKAIVESKPILSNLGLISVGSIIFVIGMNSLHSRLKVRLQLIEDALDAIENGEHGVCENCEEHINENC